MTEGVPQGKYLVDDQGQLKYLVDPAINGIVKHARQRHAGAEVQRAEDGAHGPAHRRHPHAETLLDARAHGGGHRPGAGAQRRAFAALRGGSLPAACRVDADLRGRTDALSCRPRRPQVQRPLRLPRRKARWAPACCLSTGYIAGGAIGAVLVTFLSFSDEIPRQLSAWQYRQTAIVEAKPLEQQYEDAAAVGSGHQDPRGTRSAQAGDRGPGG